MRCAPDSTTCPSCQQPLELAGRGSVPIHHDFAEGHELVVHGLPALRCPSCGHENLLEDAHAIFLRLASGGLLSGWKRGRRHAEHNTPGVRHLLGQERLQRCVLQLDVERVALPNEEPRTPSFASELEGVAKVVPVDQIEHGLGDLVLQPDVEGALRDHVHELHHRPEIACLLGPRLATKVGRKHLNLCGEPGVGKTSVAEAVARELGLTLVILSAAKLQSKHVGDTEKNISRVFDTLRGHPCVLFIDEADTLFSRRTEGSNGHEQALNGIRNHLIQELNAYDGVMVLATNMRDIYDPALADRVRDLDIPKPDAETRRALGERLLGELPGLRPPLDETLLDQMEDRIQAAGADAGPTALTPRDYADDLIPRAARKAHRQDPEGGLPWDRVLEALEERLEEKTRQHAKEAHPDPTTMAHHTLRHHWALLDEQIVHDIDEVLAATTDGESTEVHALRLERVLGSIRVRLRQRRALVEIFEASGR